MSKSFCLKIRVRYAECDPQNIVFNGRYADYLDLAATEYMRALIGGYHQLLEMGYDNHVVNLNIDWFAPAHFDDVLSLRIQTEKVGNSSFTFKVEIHRDDDKTHIATGRVTYVLVDAANFQKTGIPDQLKQILLTQPTLKQVDQSG